MAWYMRTPEDTNSTDVYLPKTTLEKAGCLGVGSAVETDPNLVFASIITPGNEKVPYPTGGSAGAYLTTPVAVETTSTLVVPQLGPDLITNGGFTSGSAPWALGGGVTVAGGVLVYTSSASTTANQFLSLTVGATYQIIFTVLNYSAGGLRPQFEGGTNSPSNAVRSSNGTFTNYIVALTGNNLLSMRAVGTTTLQVDNVILQQVY